MITTSHINHFIENALVSGKHRRIHFNYVGKKDVSSLEQLIDSLSSEQVEATDQYKRTYLHWACRDGHLQLCTILLRKFPDLCHKKDDSGRTPLHLAAREGRLNIVQLLADHNCFIDEVDDFGRTPLHFAAKHKRTDVSAFLIERGANVNALDLCGNTPKLNHDWTPLVVCSEQQLVVSSLIVKNTEHASLSRVLQRYGCALLMLEASEQKTLQNLFSCAGDHPSFGDDGTDLVRREENRNYFEIRPNDVSEYQMGTSASSLKAIQYAQSVRCLFAGLADEYFRKLCPRDIISRDDSFLRVIRYRASCERRVIVSEHTDRSLLALIPCSPVSALQICIDGMWIQIEDVGTNYLCVMVGEALQRNYPEHFKAALHRVVSTEAERTSIVFMLREEKQL